MSRIKKFDNFIKSIYEVNVSGTYLDSTKLKGIVNSEFTTSVARKKYGKVFGDAPKTAGIDWGLEFVKSSGNFFDIIFPDDFAKHFKSLARIHAEKIGNKSLDPVKTTSTLTAKTDSKIPINLLPPEYKNLGKYFPKSKIDVENIDFNILKGKQMTTGPRFNRIHFIGGIPEEFRGTGLGYIVYESFIKYLGFASSKSDASDKAKKVWSQVAQDPDFLSLVVVYDSLEEGDVFVIYKNTTISNSVLEETLKNYLSKINLDSLKEIRVDQGLKDRFPNINFEQGL